ATGNVSAAKKAVSPQKTRGVFGALFQKELSRFLGSATYMLNSGLGALMTVILGFVLIFYGPTLSTLLSENLGDPSLVFILAIAAICVTASTVDTVVPSVSLEGKTLWQIKCLPIKAETVLLAKFSLQFVIAAVPALFASVCAIIALGADIVQAVFLIVVPIVFIVLNDLFGLILALKMPNLNWTSEIVPIKQGLNVGIALFGGWIFSVAIFAPYFLLGSVLGFAVYLAIVSAILIIISVLLFAYLKKRGGAMLSEL
ncbi:MAG: hypothetical protein J6Y44_02280, partial [Clostridia bacterium]|nr:hypothetical protein [Clostridia bacterium]